MTLTQKMYIDNIIIIKGKYNRYKQCIHKNKLMFYNTSLGDVSIKLDDETIYINSRNINLVTRNSELVHIETSYLIKEPVKIHVTRSDNLVHDTYYSSLLYKLIYMLINMIISQILVFCYTSLIKASIPYISNNVIGIKQNVVINDILCKIICALAVGQQILQKYLFLGIYTLSKQNLFIEISLYLVFGVYKYLVSTLTDSLDIFRCKTYNSLKKRYDTVSLSIDQIVIVVILFSVTVILYINVICFYLLHLAIYVLYLLAKGIQKYIFIFAHLYHDVYCNTRQKTDCFDITLYDIMHCVQQEVVSVLFSRRSFREVLYGDIDMYKNM